MLEIVRLRDWISPSSSCDLLDALAEATCVHRPVPIWNLGREHLDLLQILEGQATQVSTFVWTPLVIVLLCQRALDALVSRQDELQCLAEHMLVR